LFLVTTADQRYWNTKEKIFFLGEWCKVYDQKHIWSKIDGQVLPYHWDDRKRMHRDYQYLDGVYERYLAALSQKLNKLHSENHSLRYWRIIIGPWLNFFIGIMYDRYLSVQTAKNSGLVTNTWVSTFKYTDFLAKDTFDFRRWSAGDDWNHFIYGQIIKSMGGLSYETREGQEFLTRWDQTVFSPLSNDIKNIARSLLGKIFRLTPDRFNQIFISSSYLGFWDLTRLQLSLGQFPYLFTPQVKIEDYAVNEIARNEISIRLGENQFESLLDEFIPQNMPKVYIEGYAKSCSRANEVFPKKPKLILSGPSIYYDEGYKFWVAYQVERGTKLYQHQYGGSYGTILWSALENHEIKISDRYLSWGWKLKNQPKVIPISAGKLTKIKNKIKPNPKGSILWIGFESPRFSYWMISNYKGSKFLDYIKESEIFVGAVKPQVRQLLLMRCGPTDYSWNEDKRLADVYPSLKVYKGEGSYHEQLNNSRLSIHANNSTTLLETLSADFPTLLFWNPDFFELRESADPHFNVLRQAGIFHDNPESIAKKVNDIYEDPLSWWLTPEIQDAKDRFCHQFARTNENWIAEWKEELVKCPSPTQYRLMP
jgi:putative transferase (TIGR04331 family)